MDSLVLDVGQESRTELATATAGGAGRRTRGVEIAASDLWQTVKGGKQVLQGVSFTVKACELVAVVGGSGAGKTTLLEALAGVRPAERGEVRFDGVDLYENFDSFRRLLGYVPQDDIIHADLPLERTLRYAAALRLPEPRSSAEVDAAVERALAALDLSHRADVQVGALSGGQRKRASIAVELLTSPPVFFLDEPTSGLDPASSSELLRLLRGLADAGSTVVFTTHSVQDLARCDRVVFLAREGHLAFVGHGRRGARLLRGRARRGDLRAARLGRDARAVGEAVREPSPQRRPRRDRGRAGCAAMAAKASDLRANGRC